MEIPMNSLSSIKHFEDFSNIRFFPLTSRTGRDLKDVLQRNEDWPEDFTVGWWYHLFYRDLLRWLKQWRFTVQFPLRNGIIEYFDCGTEFLKMTKEALHVGQNMNKIAEFLVSWKKEDKSEKEKIALNMCRKIFCKGSADYLEYAKSHWKTLFPEKMIENVVSGWNSLERILLKLRRQKGNLEGLKKTLDPEGRRDSPGLTMALVALHRNERFKGFYHIINRNVYWKCNELENVLEKVKENLEDVKLKNEAESLDINVKDWKETFLYSDVGHVIQAVFAEEFDLVN